MWLKGLSGVRDEFDLATIVQNLKTLALQTLGRLQLVVAKQEPREKRRLLNFILSNCTWEDGEVVATFRQPFDLLVETAVTAADIAANEAANSAKTEIWLNN